MNKKTIGAGKVINGRMTYMGEHGGFSKPVKRNEEESRRPKQQKEEVDLVFDFVHERKHQKKSTIVEVDFRRNA